MRLSILLPAHSFRSEASLTGRGKGDGFSNFVHISSLRFLPFLLITLILSACTQVTLFGIAPEVTATPVGTPLPAPAARTPVIPTPTPGIDVGAKTDALKGVKVLVWHGWDGTSSALLEKMANEFNLTNKLGLIITVAPQKNLTQLAGAVENALGKPEQPDLVIALPEQILAWQQQVVDLTPYIKQPNTPAQPVGLDLSLIPAGFLAQSELNGVRYALPAARTARYIFYNASFASELGFDKAPATTDDFRKQACSANAFWKTDADLTNDGYGGLALDAPTDVNWQTAYSWLAAGTAGSADTFSDGKFHFNTPANLSALQFVTQLRTDNCAWLPDSLTNFEHLVSRRALFITATLGDINAQNAAFNAAGSADLWTILPFPGAQPVIVPYGPDYAILKSTPALQLGAWIFLRWMLDPQNQLRWSRGTGLLPVLQPALLMISTDITLPHQWSAALALIPYSKIYPQTSAWSLADKILADGMRAFDRSYPNVPMPDILDMIDTAVKDMLTK